MSRSSRGAWVLFASIALLPPATAGAQAPVDSPGIHLGPVTLAPAVSFSTGYNSNVNFESPPVEAYEATPHLHLGFEDRAGRLKLDGFGAIEFSRFSVAEESGHNAHASARATLGSERFNVHGSYFLRDGGARPTGFEEISLASRRIEQRFEGGVESMLGPRFSFGANALFSPTRYSADALYQGSSLDEKLTFNRKGASGWAGYALTPLTRLVVRADYFSDHFLKAPRRDTYTNRVTVGLETQTPAIVTGSLFVGALTTGAPDPGVKSFTGPTFGGSLTFARHEPTLVVIRISRDPQYSVDSDLSYFISTLVDVGWRQDIAGPFESFLYGNWFSLKYQGRTDLEGDRQLGGGGGIVMRVGRYVRVGVNVDAIERTGRHPWTSQRVIAFLTYGTGFRQVERPIPTDRYR